MTVVVSFVASSEVVGVADVPRAVHTAQEVDVWHDADDDAIVWYCLAKMFAVCPSMRNRLAFGEPIAYSGHSTRGWPAMSEPAVRRRRTVGESNGAEERTRTSTGLLPLAPQASASANSATPAGR